MCGQCGVGRKMEVLMDYMERDLEGELMRRAEDTVLLFLFLTCQDFFPENEIWYILEAVINVEKHMIDQGTVHGDIRACNIFITEEGRCLSHATSLSANEFRDSQVFRYQSCGLQTKRLH